MVSVLDPAVLAHKIFAQGWLEGADQAGFRGSRRATNGVDAEMIAVNEIDIRPAGGTPHRTISFCRTPVSVAGRIVRQVSLCFDDETAARALRRVPDEPVTEQPRGNDLGGRQEKAFGQGRQHESEAEIYLKMRRACQYFAFGCRQKIMQHLKL